LKTFWDMMEVRDNNIHAGHSYTLDHKCAVFYAQIWSNI